jgi:hypothetical protein
MILGMEKPVVNPWIAVLNFYQYLTHTLTQTEARTGIEQITVKKIIISRQKFEKK